jgi:TolB-like protein/tRNA A-37 threonylcarbamoyl transferase component Bud32
MLSRIGAGGMGEVWKARDTRLERMVAIKRLNVQHVARFEAEARAIAALNHPHICQIFDVGEDYLVLEFVAGEPLRGPVGEADARRLAVEIAGALEAAHKRGILHRDLKPDNVLVTESGVKLLDFGLAKVTDPDLTQTSDGTVMGTAPYMSPEQAQGRTLDGRSDLFSLGAVLYELVSGRRAFGGASGLEILNAVVSSEPAALDSPLWPAIRRCLAKDPARRFQSAAEAREALQRGGGAQAAGAATPSIAVLPFANMSGDREQEYFSDGLTEEIINALVKIPGLKVIARTSAFAFKGQNTDIRRIAESLGVAHVLEGSVRRSGSRIRVAAQLIAAADGSHLWSERYDREMADVFEIQDELSAAIAGVLQAKLAPGGDEKARCRTGFCSSVDVIRTASVFPSGDIAGASYRAFLRGHCEHDLRPATRPSERQDFGAVGVFAIVDALAIRGPAQRTRIAHLSKRNRRHPAAYALNHDPGDAVGSFVVRERPAVGRLGCEASALLAVTGVK